ncbi:MAG TPA: HAD family hydrolase [Anaerolineae bacterium]|nr:HAD family hydrolase [Anaerolineae bacterium]
MTIKGVIFDLGSTLIEFGGEWHDVMWRGALQQIEFFNAHGFPLDPAAFLKRHRELIMLFVEKGQQDWIEYSSDKALKMALAEFGYTEVPQSLIDQSLITLYAYGESLWQPFPDTYSTLDALRAKGYRLAIISNARDAANVHRLIDDHHLRPWFDPILISAEVGVRKPNPRIFKAALDRWGIGPGEAVMVGDMLGADVLGAKNVGMRNVWATMQADRQANEVHLDTILPDATIAALAELLPLLERWAVS